MDGGGDFGDGFGGDAEHGSHHGTDHHGPEHYGESHGAQGAQPKLNGVDHDPVFSQPKDLQLPTGHDVGDALNDAAHPNAAAGHKPVKSRFRDIPEGAEGFLEGGASEMSWDEAHDARRQAARKTRAAAQPAVTPADIGAAKDGLGDRIKREIDHTRDVITKKVDSAAAKAEEAGKTVAATAEKTKGWMSRVLSTTKGKVITFAGVPTLLIGGVMTYNHFKNKGEDGPSR